MTHNNESCHISIRHVIYQWSLNMYSRALSILHDSATHSCEVSVLQCAVCSVLQCAVFCNAQCVAVCCSVLQFDMASHERVVDCNTLQHTATHCSTLQHTATHCNTLQHTGTHCNALQHTATHCTTLHHTAPHCTTLHHTAPHCNTLQHTATHCNTGVSTVPDAGGHHTAVNGLLHFTQQSYAVEA